VTSAIEIRKATGEDLAAIARIQADSRQASAWEPSSYLDYDCHVALTTGSVVAFLVSRRLADSEHEILNLAVDPVHRRQGMGRALVEHAIASSSPDPSGEPTTWFLEVRESNIAAISLYTALGFTAAGRRPDYYQDPAEAAIVMRFFS
jgi:[ribosomal protein S18]-alanine N-acetyltransferase